MCRGESVGLLSLWAGQSREKEAMSEFTVIIEQGPYGFDSRQGVDDFSCLGVDKSWRSLHSRRIVTDSKDVGGKTETRKLSQIEAKSANSIWEAFGTLRASQAAANMRHNTLRGTHALRWGLHFTPKLAGLR